MAFAGAPFTIDTLPQDLLIRRKKTVIPPVLQRQMDKISFQMGRIDVKGDGNCGYYVLQLLHFLLENKVYSLDMLKDYRHKALDRVQVGENLRLELQYMDDHYLEYLEIGLYMSDWNVNAGVIVQTNIKAGTKRARRIYPVRVMNYRPEIAMWVFILMSKNAHHYELLTVLGEDQHHQALFTADQAREIFMASESEFPTNAINAANQTWALEYADFQFF